MDTIRFKPVTMLRITGILLVLLLGVFSLAQDIGLTGPSGLEVSVCGDGQFTITVENGDTDISNLDIYAAVVTGGGSVIPTNDFTLVYESGTPNPAPDSYTLTPATVTWSDRTLAADATWTGSLTVSPHCDAFSNRELVVMVSYDYYDGVDLVHVVETPVYSGPLQVLMPNLVIELDPEVIYGIAPGETASWPVYVSNTGDGVLSDGTLTAVLAPGGGLDNLTFTPPSGSPAPLAAPIPMPDLTAGAPRTFLGTVSADLTVGTAASCQDIYVTFIGNFGCESLNCQPDVVVTGSVNLDYRTPNLSYTFSPSVIDSIPYCSESIPVTVTVTNAGANAGNIVNLTMTVDAYGVAYTVVGDTFPDIDVVVDPGSNVFEFVDADNPTIEPSIIGPNDSYTFTFTAHRDECAAVDCTSLIFEPFFYDDCGDEFEPPIKELPINIAAPVGTDYDLTVTPDAGNPSIPDEGASLGYTITAVYNHSPGETEDMTADIVVELPLSFSIVTGPGNTDGGYVEGTTATNTVLTWEDEVFSSGSGWTVTKRLVLGAGYEDADCDDDFTLHFEVVPTSGMCDGECPPPGASANIALFSDTMIVIEKTAADGGDGIIYVGEPLDFTINVYYYGPRLVIGGSLVTPPAVVTDTLPAGFWIAESLPPDPPDPVVNPTPTSATAGLLTWCLDAGELSQTGPVTFTYSLEPIPLGYPGYDPCLCGHEITNTATATLNTTGAVCAVPETSPLGCNDEDMLTFAYNCDYGDGTMGFVVEKEASPDSAERCDYDDGITFTNTITFNQAYPEGWDAITFTDNGNVVGLVFRDPDLYPGSYLSGMAHFAIVSGPSAGASEDYVITLGSSVTLGATGVGFTGTPQDGDVLEITYTLYFSDYSNGDGTAVVNWSDFLFPQTVTECTDDGGEAHAGAWVTPENPTPTIDIYNYCHYSDDDLCTYVINRCDTAKFRVYLSSTRVEYDVSVVIDLWGSGPDSNYTFNEEAAFAPDFVNMYRPDGTTPVSGVPYTISGGGRYVTWQLGDLAPLGGDSYIEFYLDTACSGGTETTATVSTDGWCDDQVYTQTMAYSASRDQRQGELLVKKTPDRLYIKSLGEDLTWTIYVTNPGSGPATNITVFDTLGSGISYVSDSLRVNGIAVDPDDISPAVYDPLNPQQTIITFTIEDLDPGETAVIELTGHVENCTDRTNKTRATWGCLDETTGYIYCGEGESLEVTVQDYGTRVIINRHQADDINTCGGTSFVTVVFKNIGKAYAYDMLLTETLPLGVEYDTTYPGGWTAVDAFGNNLAAYLAFVDGSDHTTGGGTLTWTFTNSMKPVDNSGAGDEFTIRFPVKIVGCDYASGASMMANLDYDTPCSTATTPAQDTVSTVSAPVLEVTKGPDITAGDPSDPIIWDIEITNPSGYTAMAVFLWDIPAPASYFSSVTINGLSGSGTEIDPWDIGNIAPGDSMLFTARGILSDCYPTTTGSNTAWVEWCEDCKTSASSNISMINSTPHVTPGIDLDVDYCGGSVSITLVNTGSRAYNIVLTDVFPAGFEYTVGSAEITSSEGRTFSEANEEPHYDVPTRTLTWDSNAATAPVFMDTAGNTYIEKLETLTITFNLENEMEAGEQCTSTFGDTHTVSIHYEDACDDTYDETTTGTATIPAYPNLTVTKELDPVYGVIGETDPALWHVTIDNSGGPAYGTITIVDTFGSGWDMTTVNAPATVNGTGTRTIDTGARTVTWSGVSLDTGPSSETIDIWINPLSTSPESDLGNSVLVTGACIGGCNYESAGATQNIVPGHSEIEKVYDRATATIGETVHVTITASYFGAGTPYEDVLVVDTLPTGLTYAGNLTINGTPSSITPVGQTLTWDLGNFAGTQVYVIEFDTFVANTADTDNGDTLPNTATTTYLVGATSYTDSSTTTLTITEALLTIDKTYAVVGGGPVEGSAVIEYTLTLANTGTSTAFDIDVADTLGAGLTSPAWVSGGDSHDFSGNPLLWHVNSLAVGASTTLVYRVTVEDSVTPCSMLNNEAVVTWTSINGTPALPADERTGSGTPAWNDYRTSDTLSIPVDTVASITKSLVPPTDGYWTIGSEVNYLIRVMLPRTTISDLTVTDVIGLSGNNRNGLRYVGATFVAPGGGALPTAPGESVSSPNDGTAPVTVTWTFSNIPGYDAAASGPDRYLWIVVEAVVTNVSENNDGDVIPNRVTATDSGSCLTWPGGNSASSANVTVREANLTIDKTYAVIGATPVEAGAVIRYTLTLRNTSAICTAYDIDVEDTLGTGLTGPTYVSGDVAGNITHDFSGFPGSALLWHINSLAPLASVTLVYDVTVEDSVTPCSMLNNEAVVTWTSLNGSPAEERTGSGTPAWNDYRTSDTLQIPVDTVASITKSLLPPTDGYWTIGSEVNYLIRVMLPRAEISDLTVTDVIGTAGPTNYGLRYVGATFVAPGGGSITPGEAVSSPNDGTAPVTVTWTFANIPGHLADPDEADNDRYLWIAVEAVVTNVAENNNGDSIPNRVTATSSGACLTWPGGNSASSTNVLVREANITIDKTYAVISATPVEAGAVIEYTLTLRNNGTCTAYDIDVADTLGPGLINPVYQSGGDSHDFSGNPLLWHVNSLAVGASTTLVYRVTVENTVTPCSMLNNEAVVTWTSLNGSPAEERTGDDSTYSWNDYRTDIELNVPVDTVASITKDLQPPADGYWTIGSDVYYQIRVMLPRTTISDLTVTDVIGTAGNANNGLRYEGATFVAPGGGSISPTSTNISTPNDGTVPVTVAWTFSSIPGYDADTSGSGRYLWIIVHAVVTNVDQNNNGDVIPNTVTATDTASCLTWPGGNSASSADVTVLEVDITIDKTYAVIGGGPVEGSAVIEYTLTLTNESAVCTAHDIDVEDTLGAGLTSPVWVSGGDSHNFSGNPLLWHVNILAPGASTTLVYRVTVARSGDVVACSMLDNEAVVTWTSLNGSPAEERTGSGAPTYNDYRTSDTLQVPVDTTAAITKTLTSDPTVTIGSTATYDINITLPQALITDLTVTDVIGVAGDANNGLRYVSSTIEAPGGGAITLTPTVSTPNDGTAPVTITWVFSNIPGYLATPAARDLVIHVTTDVTDLPQNKDLDVIPNTVTATDTASCLIWPGGNSASSADVTVRVPALTIEKSVTEILGADGVPRATVEPGSVVTYTITVNNVGSGEARNVTVSDTLLPEFENPLHVSGGDSHNFSGNPLTWTVNSIPGNSSATVVFSVTATSAITEGGLYINCASVVGEDILGNEIPADNTDHVSADTYDTATGTDRSCAPVTGGVPTLTLDKEILSVNGVAYTSDMTVQPGDYINFRVTVTNTGTGTAYDVNITDTISEGLGYGDYMAPIAPPVLASGTYTDASWSDYYDAGGAPAGSLTGHTHGNAPEDTGGTVPATIGTLIWDGSDIRPLSLPSSLPNPSVTGIVLPGGQTYIVEYLAYVNGSIIQHSVAENLADAEAKDGYGTTVPCNEDSTSINTREPFFVTEKTITQIDGDPTNTLVAVVDSIIDYSFTITNVGEGDAHNVNIFDTLPIGFAYVPGSANIGEPTISLDGRDLTWLVNADIASGGVYTVTFQAEVTDGTSGGTMYNVMWVEGLDLSDQPVTKDGSAITPLDTDADDLDDVPVEVDIPNVPLILVKDVTPRSVSAGAVVHYTVTFTNNRKISFYDATITDTMPHGFTYKPGTALLDGVLIADPTGNNPYVFSIGTVGPESVVRLDYYVLVSQSARHGANVNWAVLNAHDGAGKPISLKDRATVTVTDDSFFDFEKFPFLPRFSRPTASPEVPRVPEKERPRPECCLVVTAIPIRSQDFGDTVPGRPEIYYQTDIAMYAATELLVTEKRMKPWLEVQGFDPERTYLMTGLYNRMITKLGEYAQYNLGNVVMESLLGIPLEYAPGVLEKARREGTTPERAGTELTRDLAKRAGLSAVPDIQPIFLEYFGSYPYLHERIAEDKLAWEEGLMDKNIMPAALGFTLLREAGQIEMFLASTDPTERFFGLLLLTQAIEKTRSISTDLAKTAEFSPPVKYLPHFSRIEVEKGRGLTWRTTDETSTLYDHASVLWGLSKLRSVALHSADPDVRALVPQITERMNEIYRAIEAIHYDEKNKGFVSVHAPGKGDDEKSIAAKDLAFTILAMRSVLLENRDLSINTIDPKRKIVEIADFMIEELMSDDGGVYTAYNYADGTPVVGVKRTLVDNALAVRALLSAYVVTEDRKYRNAALEVYAFMVKELWYEDLMIFIDEEDPDYEVVLTPQSIGALIGALRDLVLYGDPTMRHDYLDRMSYTTDRVLDQSQLQLYENRFFPWHSPITIVPKDPNGRSYIKPIVTTIRDKGISHDLAPILVRKMVLNITPTGAIASGNEDAVSDWNKWKADLRYEVPDVIASAVIDDTFVTDEGMYFTTLTRDYQQNLNADLPAFNPYHTDPGIQVYGAFVGGEVSSYNVKNLTLNSGMGIGLSESELVRRLAKKAGKSPEKYLTDYVGARAPKDAAGDDILSRFLNRVKGAVGLAAGGRFTDIIYLEYTSSKPFYTEGISDGWDEKTFDEKLTVSSMSSTMVRQLMFILDNNGRTDLSGSDRFVNDVITMSVAAKRVVLGEIIRNAQKDGISGVPHSYTMVPDEKEKRSAVTIAEKKSTLFDDTFAIWAMALFMDAEKQGLFNGYRAVMTDVTDDEAVLAALIDALISHHYNAEYGTLVTGSVNTVEVSKALDMLTRAAEVMDDGPAKEKLTGLIKRQADFIMTRLATDTGFEPMIGLGGETIPADLCEFETLGTNVFPILALVRTWEVTGDEKYLNRALVYFDRFDESKWDQEIGLYLSSGTIYKATDVSKLELNYNNQELIAAVLLVSKLQPHLSGERKILSAYHMTTFMNRIMEIASVERYPGNEDSGNTIFSPQIIRSVKIILSESRGVGKPGDIFTNRIVIDNDCYDGISRPLSRIRIEQTLPEGFHYVPGSTRFNGAPGPDPIGRKTLNWYYPLLNGRNRLVIDYQVVADPTIAEGSYTATLDVMGFSGYGGDYVLCEDRGIAATTLIVADPFAEIVEKACVPCDVGRRALSR